ncbi:Zinc finger and SCAN domain-containing protein 29 [Massospora cicadina]|nr:Zinc finger and SCAN domain-containing protein 29 [Massospora cicadina]
MSEYRSYDEGVVNSQYSYYSYYPPYGDFHSSLSPTSALGEESKSHLKLGSDLVHPSHYMPSYASPMNPRFEFKPSLDHRISRPNYLIAYGDHHPPPEDHYNPYSSELAGPSSIELRGRAENWTYEETRVFVRLLMEHATEFQNIRRHPALWGVLANRMVQHGFPRTVEKCKNRWKVLVAKYKRCHSEMQRQQSSKFSSADKNLLILNEGSAPAAQPSQGFEFFYQMETLLKPNYHIGADGVQRRFRTNPTDPQCRSAPPAIKVGNIDPNHVAFDSHPNPPTPVTPMPPNYYPHYSLPQYNSMPTNYTSYPSQY